MKKPSISTLIGQLDKPALLNWANKIGLEGIKLNEYRKEVTTRGTNIHNQIKNYLEKSIPFEDKKHEADFLSFIERENVEDIYAIEKDVQHDWFVGRYDIFLKSNGKKYLCDFKSNDKVYFEQVLQLTAYRMTEPCDGIAIIKIPEFIFKPLDIVKFDLYENVIADLYSIYKNKQYLEEAGYIV